MRVADEVDARSSPAAIPMVHLAIRFLLELVCLGSLGSWGWQQGSSALTSLLYSLASMVPAAAVWGVFRTPGEPTGGKPVIAVPGWIRLLIELAFFALASAALWSAWSRAAAETLMTALILHAAVTWDRHWWLLRAPRSEQIKVAASAADMRP